MTPKPDSAHATKADLVNIKTRPWERTGVITQDTPSKPPRSTDPPSGPSASDPVPRGVRITKDLLERYSLTKGCSKCEAIRREDDSNTVSHNRECRERIEHAMAQNAEHREKLKEVEERQNKYLARRVEEQDVGKKDDHTAQAAAEEQVDAYPEFVVDYICYGCAPSDDDRDELATNVVDQSPKAVVEADIPI